MKINSILHLPYKRILNGFAIKYNVGDLINYIRFLFSNKIIYKQRTIDSKKYLIKVNVISLPFRSDKRKFITDQFKNLNIPFEFFNAIHGKAEYSRIKNENGYSDNSLKFLSKGSIGCIESHISIWKDLLSSEYDAFLIFEDDVVINISYDGLLKQFYTIPEDFDIVYLGSGSYKNRFNAKLISKNLFVPFSIRKGAYGYLISKKGINKLLMSLLPIEITCGGIDTILGVLTMKKKLITYHFTPSICHINYKLPSNIFNSSEMNKVLHYTENT